MRRGKVVLLATCLGLALVLSLQRADPRTISNRFWVALQVVGSEVEQYNSLESITISSDATVIGHIQSVALGRVFGEVGGVPDADGALARYVSVRLEVRELLSGSLPPEHRSALILEMLLPDLDAFEVLISALPPEDAIYFLRSKTLEAQRLGFTDEIVAEERDYYRLVIADGLLRLFDGSVEPRPGTTEPFLLAVRNADAEDVVALITGFQGAP